MKATIRKSFSALVLPAAAALALLGSTSTSDAGAFIKLGDIKGQAKDSDHNEWIDLQSLSQPIAKPVVTDSATGATRRRGETSLGDVVCVKEMDKSSPKIAEAICLGTNFPEVEIHFTTTVQNSDGTTSEAPYLKYKLKNVIITSYSFHGTASADPLPTEEITLGYTEVEWTYLVLDKDTKQPTGEQVSGYCVDTANP